jgi:transcriptional regulator with XRE-family HTH domain
MSVPKPTPGAGDTADLHIGYNVHGLLYRQKASQRQLAHALGITPSVLSKKLRGESSWSARQIAVTAAFLDIDPGRLFREPTLPKVSPYVAIRGGGRTSIPRSPLLFATH